MMAFPYVVGQDLQKLQVAVCEALGIEPRTVRGIDFHFAVGELATAEIDYYLTQEQAAKFSRVMETFALHPLSLDSAAIPHDPA